MCSTVRRQDGDAFAQLLFCYSITNPSTQIFVAVTSGKVAVMIGSSEAIGNTAMKGGEWLPPSVTHALGVRRIFDGDYVVFATRWHEEIVIRSDRK